MADYKEIKTGLAAEKKYHQKIKEKKISREKKIEKELKNIYRQDGKMPEMARLEHKKRSRFRGLIILIFTLFIIFAVSVLGSFVFQPKPKFSGDKVSLEIKAPFNTVSGERIDYEIKIYNGEEVSLTKTNLYVYLPSGFIFENSNLPPKLEQKEDTESINPSIKNFELGDLFSQQIQIINITGKLIGPVSSIQTISTTLSYYPVNFNSEFQKNNSFSTQIVDSLLDLNLEYPSQTANLETTNFIIGLKNKSQATEISNLQIELNYSSEFTLSESQLIQEDKKNPVTKEKLNKGAIQKIWSIEKLLPQEEVKIKFTGQFNVDLSKSLDFNLKLRVRGPTEDYIDQKEQKFSIEVVKGDLLTNLIINGFGQNKPIDFGGTINCLLKLENKSSKVLGDIKVRAVLDSPLLDWNSLNDQNKGIRQDNQILWTKNQIPALSLLIPEQEVEIPFQIKLKDNEGLSGYKEEDFKVKSFFEAQINKIDNKDAQVVVPSNTIINEINTDLGLQAQVRYFANDSSTIGSGPLPPIVGQKTSYKVFLKLTNSLHEITNIKVLAKLPDYVTYEGKENISTGTLAKTEQNQVVWEISRIPASVKESTAEFEISITPLMSDVNKILTLIPQISLEATDGQTQTVVTKSLLGLTTSLESDNLGKNKGVVQAQ